MSEDIKNKNMLNDDIQKRIIPKILQKFYIINCTKKTQN